MRLLPWYARAIRFVPFIIMILLIGYNLKALANVMKRIDISFQCLKCKWEMDSLRTAIETYYHTDNRFPSENEFVQFVRGSYDAGKRDPSLDGFGHPYAYVLLHNVNGKVVGFRVTSAGPDGKMQTADDISVQWRNEIVAPTAEPGERFTNDIDANGKYLGATRRWLVYGTVILSLACLCLAVLIRLGRFIHAMRTRASAPANEVPPAGTPTLVIQEGNDVGRSLSLPQHNVEIGRGDVSAVEGDRISIAEPTISRAQARLSFDPRHGSYVIHHESKAANPTLVNGRVVSKQPLHVGDIIKMGSLVMRLTNAADGAMQNSPARLAMPRVPSFMAKDMSRFLPPPSGGPTVAATKSDVSAFRTLMMKRIQQAFPDYEVCENNELELGITRHGVYHVIDLEALFYLCQRTETDRDKAIESFLKYMPIDR